MLPCMLDKISGVRIYTKNKKSFEKCQKVSRGGKNFQKLSGSTFSPKMLLVKMLLQI